MWTEVFQIPPSLSAQQPLGLVNLPDRFDLTSFPIRPALCENGMLMNVTIFISYA